MRPRPTFPKRAARWSLLFAALLQFGIAVFGPSGHFASSLPVAAAGSVRHGQPEQGAPLPHDEFACAVCHTLASASLPHFGPALPPDPLSAREHLREPPTFLPPPRRALVRARAPPVA